MLRKTTICASALAKADLQANDVIVGGNDETINQVSDLPASLSGLVIKIRRSPQELTLKLVN